MSGDSERLGFFHWLIKSCMCCCKSKDSSANANERGSVKEDCIEKANQIELLPVKCANDINCKISNNSEDCLNGKTVPTVVGENNVSQSKQVSVFGVGDGKEAEEVATALGAVQKPKKEEYDIERDEDLNPEIKSLMNCLSRLECPFVWKPDIEGAVLKDGGWIYNDNERNGLLLIEYLSAKEYEFRLVQNKFFRTLCISLVLAYEKALLGQLASSAADIYQCQMLVSKAESDTNCSEKMLVQDGRKDGIHYVLLASIAHIKFLKRSFSSSWDTVRYLMEKYNNLKPEARAMVHGLHAGVLMEYGYRGNRMATEPVQTALALDPSCWLWSLFLGKLLGRFRRKTEFHMPAGREELLALQNAAELHPEAECLSHLADVYKHMNAVITRQGFTPSYLKEVLHADEIDSLPQLARDLYAKAATKEPNCPYNNARCAKGLLSLPTPFKDIDLAEKYMVRALHLAPNDSLVNHYAAYYYETRKEFEQALDSYRKAISVAGGSLSGALTGVGNFPAELGYLGLQHRLETGQQEWVGSSTQVGGGGVRGGRYSITRGAGSVGCASRYSPLFQLDSMLTKYKSTAHQVQTLCNKGYYLLTFEKDMLGAMRAFVEAIRKDPESNTLKKFWSIFGSSTSYQPSQPVNVFHLMKEEIEKALSSPLSTDNITYLEGILDFVCENESAVCH